MNRTTLYTKKSFPVKLKQRCSGLEQSFDVISNVEAIPGVDFDWALIAYIASVGQNNLFSQIGMISGSVLPNTHNYIDWNYVRKSITTSDGKLFDIFLDVIVDFEDTPNNLSTISWEPMISVVSSIGNEDNYEIAPIKNVPQSNPIQYRYETSIRVKDYSNYPQDDTIQVIIQLPFANLLTDKIVYELTIPEHYAETYEFTYTTESPVVALQGTMQNDSTHTCRVHFEDTVLPIKSVKYTNINHHITPVSYRLKSRTGNPHIDFKVVDHKFYVFYDRMLSLYDPLQTDYSDATFVFEQDESGKTLELTVRLQIYDNTTPDDPRLD